MTDELKKDVKPWIEVSRYDLDTAKAMLRSRRYLYVLFMCQQSLEKLLTAHVTARTGEFPRRIHNLVRLEEAAGLHCAPDEKALRSAWPCITSRHVIRPRSRHWQRVSRDRWQEISSNKQRPCGKS